MFGCQECRTNWLQRRFSGVKNIKGSYLKYVGTGKIKSQDRFRFDGGQATNVDLKLFRLFDGLIEWKTRIHRPDPHDG